MPTMSPIVQRLLNQQLACPQFGTPAEVVVNVTNFSNYIFRSKLV